MGWVVEEHIEGEVTLTAIGINLHKMSVAQAQNALWTFYREELI